MAVDSVIRQKGGVNGLGLNAPWWVQTCPAPWWARHSITIAVKNEACICSSEDGGTDSIHLAWEMRAGVWVSHFLLLSPNWWRLHRKHQFISAVVSHFPGACEVCEEGDAGTQALEWRWGLVLRGCGRSPGTQWWSAGVGHWDVAQGMKEKTWWEQAPSLKSMWFIASSSFPFIHQIIHPSSCLSIHPSIHSPTSSSFHPSIHSPTYQFIHPSIHPSFLPSTHLPIHWSTYPSVHIAAHLSIYPPIQPCIHPAIQTSIHPSIHLPVHLPIFPSVHLLTHLSICPPIQPFIHLSIQTFIYPSISPSTNPSANSSIHPYTHSSIHQLF